MMSRLLGSVRRPWMVALFALLAATIAVLSQSAAPSQAVQAPTNLVAPVVTPNDSYFGYAQNKQLTVTPGTWTDSPTSITYQWYRCSSSQTASATDPTNCQVITGDTGITHLTTAGDVGFYLTVKETATNASGSSSYYASVSNSIAQSNVFAVGNQSTCVIRLGKVYCTGNNGSTTSGSVIYGMYGNGTTGTSGGLWVGPAATATGTVISDAVSISSSFGNTCVLTYTGAIYCEGINSYGQLGNGSSNGQSFFFAPMMQSPGVAVTGASALAVGDGSTCFIKTGSVYCLGSGGNGSLGDGTATSATYPVKVKLDATHYLSNAIQIAGGGSNTYIGYGSSFCAITDDGGSVTVGGTLYCWGANDISQLGDMSAVQKNWATLITVGSGTSGVTNVSISSGHACAIKNTGVYCWGYNLNGQTGIGVTNNPQNAPVAAITNAGQSFSSGFAAVSTDVLLGGSSCFIRNDGANFCTGLNSSYNLDQGNTSAVYAAKAALDWTAGTSEVHLSSNFSCGFNAISNKLICTGNNALGGFGVPGGVGSLTAVATESTSITGTIGVPSKAGIATSTAVKGNANVGDTLSDGSVWTGFPAPSLSYQWYSCSSAVTASASVPGTCTAISGATTSSYTVQAGDLGSYITPLVSATNAAGVTTTMLTQANSVGQLPSASAATVNVPTSSTGPITGMTLTTSAVTWTGANPTGTTTTQWFRCATSSAAVTSTSILSGCKAITGATGSSYQLTKSENGFFISAAQVYTSTAGTAYSFSATAAQVRSSNAVGGDDDVSCAMRYGQVYCWGPVTADQDAAYNGTSKFYSLDYVPTVITKTDGTPLTDVVQFDSTKTGSCAVRVDKSLWCWGESWGNLGLGATANPNMHFRATKVSTNDGNWVQVAMAGYASASGTCAIDTSGAVWCSSSYGGWGFTGDNAANSATFTKSTTLTSGFIQIVGSINGSQNFCALKNNGALYCWGNNASGNVGTGNSTAVTTAVIPAGLESGVTAVAMNGGTTCAIKNGSPWCWGVNGNVGTANSFGIPGTLTTTSYLFSPVNLTLGLTQGNWTGVIIDRGGPGYQDRICLINSAQALYCAGANSSGQLNTGNTSGLTTFTATRWSSGVTDFVTNSQGANNASCAAVNNALYCIGSNVAGELGNGTYGNTPSVTTPPTVNPYLSNGVGLVEVAPTNMTVTTSQNYAVGQTITATLSGDSSPAPSATYQWYSCTQTGAATSTLPGDCSAISAATSSTYTVGSGDVGSYIRVQVSLTNAIGSSSPVSAAALVGAAPSASTPSTTISIPGVKLFTGNVITAPAMPTFTGTPTPTATNQWYRCTATNSSWVTTLPSTCYPVEAGAGSTYTLTHSDDGFFMMFGQTASSSAGSASLFSPTTIQVIYANKIAMSGDGGACVIKNGKVYCWGWQLAGGVLGASQVLNTSAAYVNAVTTSGVVRSFPSTPVQLTSGGPLSEVVSIAMGKDHACAVTYAGSLYCWGTNTNSVLGDGTSTSRYTASPVLVSSGVPLTNVTQVAAGSVNTCAISNGAVICWGQPSASNGILASALTYANTQVTNLTSGVQQVVLSDQNACAIQAAAAKCWGIAANNANASATVTPNTTSPPVAAPSSYINGKLVRLNAGVSNLSSGLNQGCAIKLGTTYCWGGSTPALNLGNPGYGVGGAFTSIPAATDGTTFDTGSVSLASGTQSALTQPTSCVIKTTGATYCSGNGNTGAGSSGTSIQLPTPANTLTSGVTEMAVGGMESCAIKNGSVWCAGNDGANSSALPGYMSNLLQDSSSLPPVAQVSHILVGNIPTPLGFSESAPITGTASISGYTVVGNTLTSVISNFENTGAWQGLPTPAMTQQWYTCTSPGAATSTLPSDCTTLSGVTGSTATVTSGQTGMYFRVQATATNSFGTATLYSAAYGPVGDAPTLTTASTLNSPNSPVLNSTTSITGNAGTFGGTTNAITTTYQWYRCLYSSSSASTSVPTDCMATPNGANTSYSLTSSDVGVYLRFATIGTASTGKVISLSASSAQVMEGAKVAMATNSTCALKLGRVYCWGSNTDYGLGNGSAQAASIQSADNATPVKTSSTTILENVVDLKGSKTSYCAIDTAGALYCWGSNTTGQTGNNTATTVPTQYASTPSAATDNAVFTSGVVGVSVGPAGTCAWKTSGLVYCWGENDAGILGSSSFPMNNTTKALIPQLIPSLTNVSTMDVGSNAACAVSLGAVYCWGNNNSYLTVDGLNSAGTQWTPVARSTVTSNVTTVSVGVYNPCVLMNYGVYCWANNATGAFGVGNAFAVGDFWRTGAIGQSGPTSTGVTDLFMNKAYYSGCAMKATSALYCWGVDAEGSQPGLTIPSNNSYNASPVLSTITGASYLTSSAGSPNAYCLIVSNALSCEGRATNYILGNSTTTPNLVGTASAVPSPYSPASFSSNLGADYVAPTFGSSPTVSGSNLLTGQSLTTTVPTATGFPNPTVTTGWFDCTGLGNATTTTPIDCSAIANASSSTYTMVNADLNLHIRSGFTASNAAGTVNTYSAATSNAVSKINYANVVRPIGGGSVLQAGDVITQPLATWSTSSPVTASIAWYKCGNDAQGVANSVPSDCTAISGATSNTYTVKASDAGNYLRSLQTATNSSGTVMVMSKATNFVISTTLPKVAIGQQSTCVIKNGGVECAGAGTYYQLGNNSVTTQTTPVKVLKSATSTDYLTGVTAIFSGTAGNYCAITATAQLWCWGASASNNLLSTTSSSDAAFAVQPLGTTKVANVGMGNNALCAVTEGAAGAKGGALWCWGNATTSNYYLGDGTSTAKWLSAKVLTIASGVSQVSMGSYDTCAVVNEGLSCWGAYGTYAYGVAGASTNQTTPLANPTLATGVTKVAVGSSESCAIKDGGVYCWGLNSIGTIGNGTTTQSQTPTAVSAATDSTSLASGVVDIALSRDTTSSKSTACAIKSTGALYCWGYGTNYNLLDGTTTASQKTPKPSTLTTGVTGVAIGTTDDITCAIKTLTLYCAGPTRTYAQYMNGLVAAQTTPTSVPAYNAANYVAAPTLPTVSIPTLAVVGTALNPDLSVATGIETPTQTFTWYTCASSHVGNTSLPSDCTVATGATAHAASYIPITADKTQFLMVAVTQSNSGGPSVTGFSDTTNAVVLGTQTVSISGGDTIPVVGGATTQLTATSSSGLSTFTWSSNTPNVCTVDNSGVVTAVGGGRCEIVATQAGNSDYASGSGVVDMTLARAAQTISWTAPSSVAVTSVTTLAGLASSGSAITYASTTPAVCTVSGSQLTAVSLGTCNLTADQAGSLGFFPAAQVTASIQVVQAAQVITFTASTVPLINGTFTLNATVDSGQSLSFSVADTSICTVSGSTLTLVAQGACVVTATQAGSTNYLAATPVTATINIVSTPTVVTQVTSDSSATFGVDVSATAGTWQGATPLTTSLKWYSCTNSGNAVAGVGNFAALAPADCTAISGATEATFTPTAAQVGSRLRVAEQASNIINGTTNYYTVFAAATAAVAKQSQTITFGALADATYGDSAITLTATSDRGKTISYASSNSAVCTISGSTLTVVAAGSCDVTASQAGDSSTLAATSVTQTLTVNKKSQITSLPDYTSATYGDAPRASGATATSGLTPDIASVNTSVCTVSGLTITIVAPGTCTISAIQLGNSNWFASTATNKSFTVNKANQTITFTGSTQQFPSGNFTVSGSASSGLALSFASNTTSVCTVSGSTVTPVTLGTCTIKASQAGNSNYNAAADVTANFTIESVPVQTASVSIGAASHYRYGTSISYSVGTWTGTPTVTLSHAWYRCSTSQPLSSVVGTDSSVAPVGCSLITGATGTSYSPVQADIGNYIEVAEVASNSTSAGTNNRTTFVATATAVEKQTQTISFGALANATYGDAPITLSASSDARLAITYTSSDSTICSISGSTLTILKAGSCNVTASQAGNATTLAATSVVQALSIARASQTITLPNFTSGVYGGAAKVSGATASSGLTVTLTSANTAVCTVSGLSVNLVAAGNCSITASQTGNGNYNAASTVTKSFTIAQAAQTISFNGSIHQLASGDFTVSGSATSGLPLTFTSADDSFCTVSGSTVTPVALGTCTVIASQAGDSNWSAAADVSADFTIESVPFQTDAETISAAAHYRIGEAVSVNEGTWDGTPTVSVSRAWFRCVTAPSISVATGSATTTKPADCSAISGATDVTYTPVAADLGKYLAVAETASNVTSNGLNLRTTYVSTATAVEKQTQYITFHNLASATYRDPAITLTATSNLGKTISYASSNTAVCTISGSTLTIVAAGSCDVTATQAGDTTTLAATSVTKTLTVNRKAQTTSLPDLADAVYGDATRASGASASSGLTVTLASADTTVCTVNGLNINLVAAGTCTISATQLGDTNWQASNTVTKSFRIAQAADAITFAGSTHQLSVGDFTISATTVSGEAVSLNSTTPQVCSVNGSTVTPYTDGDCVITASSAGNSNYSAPADATATFTIERAVEAVSAPSMSGWSTYWFNQAIDYTPGTWNGSGTVTVTHIWYSCVTAPATGVVAGADVPAGCTAVSETSTGTYVPTTADVGNYIALAETASNVTATGTSVATSWIVSSGVVTKWTQNLTFGALADATYGDLPITLNAFTDQGQQVSYRSSDSTVCSITNGVLSILAAGSCDITASQPGNAAIAAVTPITQTLTINKADQTISFADLNDVTYSTATVAASATASSNLSVTFTSDDTSVCTVSGTTITQVASGTCSITATQAGDNNYNAATPVTKTFQIAKATQTVTFTLPQFMALAVPAGLALNATSDSGLAITYTVADNTICDIQNGHVVPLAEGSCDVTATQAGDDRFLPASQLRTTTVANYPVVTSIEPTGDAYTNATSTSFNVNFDGNVSGFTAADLTQVPAGACDLAEPVEVNGSAAHYTVALSNCAEGSVRLKLAAGSVSNGAPGPMDDFVGQPVSIDFAFQQTVTVTSQFTNPTNHASLVYNVTFAEPVTGFTTDDLTVSGTGTSTCVSSITGSGTDYVVTLDSCGDGTVTLALNSNSVADLAGNVGPSAAVTTSAFTVDRVAPDAPVATGLPDQFTRATDLTATFDTVAGNSYHCTLNGTELQNCSGSVLMPASTFTPGDYTFEVWAEDAAGNTSTHYSHTWSVGNYARPSTPVINVQAFDRTAYNHLTVSWAAVVQQSSQLPVTGLKLEYSTDGTTWTAVPDLAANATSYDLTVRSGNVYSFRLRALSAPFAVNNSDLSAVATYTAIYKPTINAMSTSAALLKPVAGTTITLTGNDFRDYTNTTPASTTGTVVTITDFTGKPYTAVLQNVTATSIRFVVPAVSKIGMATLKVTVGAGNYLHISANRNLNIVTVKANQVLTFTAPVSTRYGSQDTQLNATLDSLATPTFVVDPASIGICSVSTTGLLHPLKGGACVYKVTSAASDAFNAFTSANFTTTIQKLNVSINFALPADLTATFDNANRTTIKPTTYQLTAIPDVSIQNTTVKITSTPETTCFVDGTNVLHMVAVGTCTVSAIAENDFYRTEVPAIQTFGIVKNNQNLTYLAPGTNNGLLTAATATDAPAGFQLSAFLDSGLTPNFTVADPTVCTVDATGVVIWSGDLVKNPGQLCTVTIGSDGDANYNPLAQPRTVSFTASHVPPLAPVGGFIHEPDGSLAVGRTGGVAAAGADGVAVVVVTGTKITITPFSSGLYIGPITANVTIPYYVPVKGVLTLKNQNCVIKFGVTKKYKPTDPMAWKRKAFPNTKACTALPDAVSYFAQGNRLLPTIVVTRDRRWPTTYIAKTGNTGKGAKIYPSIKTWHLTIG